jgi:curved DNA-binding protein CbpA
MTQTSGTPFDPYAVLGVSVLAGSDEIRHAYRALAQRFHPDVNPNDPEAAARFAEATLAYEILQDAARRRAYDLARAVAQGPRPARAAPGPTGNTRVRGPGARPSHREREDPPRPPARDRDGADPFAVLRTFAKLAVVAIALLIVAVAIVAMVQAPVCGPGEWRGCRQPSPTAVPGG